MDRRRAWTLGVLLLLGAAARVDTPHATRGDAHTRAGSADPAHQADTQARQPGQRGAPIRVAIGQGTSDGGVPMVVLEADERGSAGLRAVRVLGTHPPAEPGLPRAAGPISLSVPPPSTAGLTTAAALAFLALRRRT